MFEINYRIIIDKSYWKTMNLEQFEKEGGIEGFFQLNLHSAITIIGNWARVKKVLTLFQLGYQIY